MPRRNRNVRQRNVPRAAQTRKGTERALVRTRQAKRSTRQPSAQDRADAEMALYAGYSAQLD